MRRVTLVLILAVVGVTEACTHTAPPSAGGSPTADGSPPSPAPSTAALILDVVAATPAASSTAVDRIQAEDDAPYIAGMRVGLAHVNGHGGVGGRPLALAVHPAGSDPGQIAAAVRAVLASGPTAVLYAGPGPALSPLRYDVERAGAPVVLLGGDLYTSEGLFPQVFQTAVPWVWQAKVLTRYLVKDRRARRVLFIGFGLEAQAAAAATRAAMRYWGGDLAGSFVLPEGGSLEDVLPKLAGADTVVDFGGTSDAQRLARAVRGLSPMPRVVGGASLLGADPRPAPGTAACYAYTWAGWAHPIKRVAAFDDEFRAAEGRPPTSLEQEGYDAVRLLAHALAHDHDTGGAALVRELQTVSNAQYSSFPIQLGPDDHQLLPRDELGLFAVAGPDEKLDPWQTPGSEPWRPIMRTFTTDGSRDSILDEDRPVFFPSWRKDQPGPPYWEARYGISTKPSADALH